MEIKALLFDLYGTLIDIETDESMEEIHRTISHFLTYYGVYLHREEVRALYYQILNQQKAESLENHPEINVQAIWETFLVRQGRTSRKLAETLANLYRGISRKRLQLYPSVKRVLDELRRDYTMAIISDGQPCWALAEMKAAGLDGYFTPVIISAAYGFRKPDPRLIQEALDILKLAPCEVLFIGNDMYRDIHGASQLNIKTIFFASNQGRQSHAETAANYVASHFEDVLQAVQALS